MTARNSVTAWPGSSAVITPPDAGVAEALTKITGYLSLMTWQTKVASLLRVRSRSLNSNLYSGLQGFAPAQTEAVQSGVGVAVRNATLH